MSEQPTEYGKELIEAVAEGICRVMFADESVHGEARCCKLGGASGCCVKDLYPEARAALLAACAKLKEPPEKTLDEMDTVYCEAGIEAALSWFFSQLRTEIGSPMTGRGKDDGYTRA